MKTVILLVVLVVGAFARAQAPEPVADENAKEKVIATVLGKNVTAKDKDKLVGLIFGALLEKFAKENKIEPTAAELDAFVRKSDQADRRMRLSFEEDQKRLIEELKSATLPPSKRKEKESELQRVDRIVTMLRELEEQPTETEEEIEASRREVGTHFVTSWKINKALHAKYGGRVIFQQMGPEPLDAYREFLEEQEKNGAFAILDKKNEADFWRYFRDDSLHHFYPKDLAESAFDTPWWTMPEPEE